MIQSTDYSIRSPNLFFTPWEETVSPPRHSHLNFLTHFPEVKKLTSKQPTIHPFHAKTIHRKAHTELKKDPGLLISKSPRRTTALSLRTYPIISQTLPNQNPILNSWQRVTCHTKMPRRHPSQRSPLSPSSPPLPLLPHRRPQQPGRKNSSAGTTCVRYTALQTNQT